MALFSTLLSASNEETTVSSSAIPTLVQLYQSKLISLDPNTKLMGHAVLSYQAIEVAPPLAEGESSLFGHKRNKTNVIEKPNLGVWNCLVNKSSGVGSSNENSLVDQLLRIPVSSPRYCFTIDLADPSNVEPTIAVLHDTLVRLLIQEPPQEAHDSFTTSLASLRKTQFGLAPNDDEGSAAADTTALAESDENVKFALMICAILPPTNFNNSSSDAYKETQEQALVLYHLRKYAAALNASLCFVRTTEESPEEREEQPTMSITRLSNVWKKWAEGNSVEDPAMYAPGKQQEETIDTILLKNANYPGHWDASKDSIWKALPASSDETEASAKSKKNIAGDDGWLAKLRDSVVAADANLPSTSKTPAVTDATPKADAAAASSFFENLLKSP